LRLFVLGGLRRKNRKIRGPLELGGRIDRTAKKNADVGIGRNKKRGWRNVGV